jgi:hypothetical protein
MRCHDAETHRASLARGNVPAVVRGEVGGDGVQIYAVGQKRKETTNMSNGDADMIDTVIAGMEQAKCAKDCLAHGPTITVLKTVATGINHTNAALKCVADLAEDTNVKVTSIQDKIASRKPFDVKDAVTWVRLAGAVAVVIVLLMQALQSRDGAKRDRALDVLLQLQGVDPAKIEATSQILTGELSKVEQ